MKDEEDKSFERVISNIENLTDLNQHTESLIIGAKFFNLQTLQKMLEHVRDLHRLHGRMPRELIAYRETLRSELLKHAKAVLSKSKYEIFQSSY